MPLSIYPYTVTNSYKGGLFMRTYSRNVRRAWDGDEYRPPKRMRIDEHSNQSVQQQAPNKENTNVTALDLEDNLERAIRETSVAALSSSPSRKNSTVFSTESREDDGTSTITPPSSPPTQLHLTPPNVKPRKPTFSFLDKQKEEKPKTQNPSLKRKHDALATSRRDDSEPLSEIHNSSRACSAAPIPAFIPINGVASCDEASHSEQGTAPRPTELHRSKPLIQSVLDFGQSLQPVTCPSCNMTYTASVQSDSQLHTMYHNRHSTGIELGKSFLKSAMKWCYEVSHIPGSVVVVDRKLSAPARKVVLKVLEVVNKELGSVDILEEELWSQRALPGVDAGNHDARKCDRYKVFLHVLSGRCVGVCLAERITRAYKVMPRLDDGQEKGTEDTSKVKSSGLEHPPTPTSTSHDNGSHDNSLTLSNEGFPAVVGVSRIWTSRSVRRKGIANNLLECVMNQFIYGMEIEKTDLAFSQPTEMGTALAKSWFSEGSGLEREKAKEEGRWGWKVYVEE